MAALGSEAQLADAAAAGGAEKRRYVRRIFSEIAPRYDLLNHLLSANIDRAWRRIAIRELGWERYPDGAYLDLCAGTLDVAAQLSRQPGFAGTVLGADFAEPMLRAGEGKAPRTTVAPVAADALQLPLADGSMRGAIVAFGIRNVVRSRCGAGRDVSGAGARRAIRHPGVLEAAACGRAGVLSRVLPPRAARDRRPGERPADGVPVSPAVRGQLPGEPELARRMETAGFRGVRWYPLTLGIAAVHVGERP